MSDCLDADYRSIPCSIRAFVHFTDIDFTCAFNSNVFDVPLTGPNGMWSASDVNYVLTHDWTKLVCINSHRATETSLNCARMNKRHTQSASGWMGIHNKINDFMNTNPNVSISVFNENSKLTWINTELPPTLILVSIVEHKTNKDRNNDAAVSISCDVALLFAFHSHFYWNSMLIVSLKLHPFFVWAANIGRRHASITTRFIYILSNTVEGRSEEGIIIAWLIPTGPVSRRQWTIYPYSDSMLAVHVHANGFCLTHGTWHIQFTLLSTDKNTLLSQTNNQSSCWYAMIAERWPLGCAVIYTSIFVFVKMQKSILWQWRWLFVGMICEWAQFSLFVDHFSTTTILLCS